MRSCSNRNCSRLVSCELLAIQFLLRKSVVANVRPVEIISGIDKVPAQSEDVYGLYRSILVPRSCLRALTLPVGTHMAVIEKIVSGGQTGVDRAALDVAIQLGIPVGGWCPRGRRAEDGRIPDVYPLRETTASNYSDRTERNVRESDGTLIVSGGPLTGGTGLTRSLARRLGKPVFVIDLRDDPAPDVSDEWLAEHSIRTLNVAGPRESQQPGIYGRVTDFLVEALNRVL